MKISFSWQILSQPLTIDISLENILKPPVRKAIKQILPDQSSLNTTVQPLNLDSPIIPLLIAYKVQQGFEYQIQAQLKVSSGNPLKLISKRTLNKSHIYLQYKMMDLQAYDNVIQLLIVIKYGRPENNKLHESIKQSKTKQLIKLLSSRQATLQSMFIYEKIKKQIIINQPVTINYKLTEDYILFTFSVVGQQSHQLQILKGNQKQVIIESIQIMNWLASGSTIQTVRNLNIPKYVQSFSLKNGQTYSLFFKLDTPLRGCQIPYIVNWRWEGCTDKYQILKYIKENW